MSKVGGFAVAAILVAGVTGAIMCSEVVPAGHVGIQYTMSGGVQRETLSPGFHLVSPTTKVTEYSVAIEQGYFTKGDKDSSFDIPTSDGKTINVDMEYSYHFDADMASTIFNMFRGQDGKTIEDSFIRGKMKAWAAEVSSTYTVIDLFGDKRAELNTSMHRYMRDKFAEYGIVIDSVNFTRIETDEETAAAIQKKVNAQQELELAKIEAETAQVEAEKDKQVALIDAEKKKEVAQLEAEASLIKAQAEAEANREVAASLTSELLNKLKYEKWNGQLPSVQSGGDSSLIVDVGSNGSGATE